MSVPPPPPPPPPPSASIKAPIPATNKALLTSIQKGTKLKKVPDSVKNDRSEAKLSTKPTSNGPQMRPASDTKLCPQGRFSGQQAPSMTPAPNKQFNNIQAELANQLGLNIRKPSLPASNPPQIRTVGKNNVPLPNQINSINKPPPPPPGNKKPLLSSNTTEFSRPMLEKRDNVDKPFVQPPVIKKPQPQLPKQLSYLSVSEVSRVTSNPPPPLPNVSREAPKLPITLVNPPLNNMTNPPRVPARVMNPLTNSTQPSNQIRTSSVSENQFKLDRAPPLPPSNQTRPSSVIDNQYKLDRAPPLPPSNQIRTSSVIDNQYKLDRAPPAPPSNQSRSSSGTDNQYKLDRAPPAPPSNQSRSSSVIDNPYKLDRAPPPPLTNSFSHQRMSKFDKRFKFPDETNFPRPSNMRST